MRRIAKYKGKQAPIRDLPEAEIIEQLHTGAGIRREGLMETLTGMGLKRVKLAAAQRTCPSLAGYYVVHLADLANKDSRVAL